MWTQFWDMHSGGDMKEPPYDKIYIEAAKKEAKAIFYNRFGHNPERVTCTCCGDDYSIQEHATLEQATGYHRGCAFNRDTEEYIEESRDKWSKYLTLNEYKTLPDVLVIPASEIRDEERRGDVPEQGYIWVG